MSQELLIALAVLAFSGVGFLAYNLPKTFDWLLLWTGWLGAVVAIAVLIWQQAVSTSWDVVKPLLTPDQIAPVGNALIGLTLKNSVAYCAVGVAAMANVLILVKKRIHLEKKEKQQAGRDGE